MWEVDDFAKINPPATGQNRSPLEHLLRIGASNAEFLGRESNLIEQVPPSFACFAQLPYSAVSREHVILRPGKSRIFEIHLFPASISIQQSGEQDLRGLALEPTNDGNFLITQAIGITKYWGIRKEWFPAYQRMVTPTGLKDGIVVPSENSWLKDHRSIDAKGYENDLARRLLQDFLIGLKRILPLELAQEYAVLLNYFVMPFPGRITYGGSPVPTVSKLKIVQPFRQEQKVTETKMRKSVFLSYGGPDAAIAERLRSDLVDNKIDTWWFPENAQWGEKLHHEIRKNIGKYDRLLLICSRRSMIRTGVLHELEEVFEREAQEGGNSIAIPIALDGVLDEDWWLYEPDPLGEPVQSNLDEDEILRRQSLALRLRNRVAGDLKGSLPGDDKWKKALEKIIDIL